MGLGGVDGEKLGAAHLQRGRQSEAFQTKEEKTTWLPDANGAEKQVSDARPRTLYNVRSEHKPMKVPVSCFLNSCVNTASSLTITILTGSSVLISIFMF